MQAQRCFYLFPEESLYLQFSSCGYYASKSITAMLRGRLCWRLNAQNQTNVRGENCGFILFAEEQKKRWCLSETGESCSWWGSRVASRIIAKQRVCGGGKWVALPESRLCDFGSKAAKSRNRMQRTQVRIRIQNVSAVYRWGQSQSSSEAVTLPADSFFMLLLMKISFRCAAGGSSTSLRSTPSSCQTNTKNPTPPAPHTPEPSSKHLLDLQK